MNVDFSVEGALVMEDVLDVRDIETTGSNISAHQSGAFHTLLSVFNSLNSSLEAIERLQTGSLLHLGVQAEVFNFEES